MKKAILLTGLLLTAGYCHATTHHLDKAVLQDKIKGAWAAQVIGVTYGFPIEFKFMSTMVPDNYALDWSDTSIADTFSNMPSAYDDIYVDLTFVQVLQDKGMAATAQDFGNALAHADYPLWFANQVARNNILEGLQPPASGYWQNNPAADDIDFQIESDFIGIMNPGMANSAARFSDRIGHIMAYGDGFYGGVFVAAMYANAFVDENITSVINNTLQLIPVQSQFHQAIADVIQAHQQHPNDWRAAWFAVHRKWAATDHDPKGIAGPFNIDAKINASWVVLALLYGQGDFTRTLNIAARAGDDADCNPATAAGILGALKGYRALPEYWTRGLSTIEDRPFPYTQLSLKRVYQISYQHALHNINANGGAVHDQSVDIVYQAPKELPLEVAFPNHFPHQKHRYAPFFLADYQGGLTFPENYHFQFTGNGFVVMGEVSGNKQDVVKADLYIDGKRTEQLSWPANYLTRRFFLAWDLTLSQKPHQIMIKLKEQPDSAKVTLNSVAVYGETPVSVSY